MIAPAYQLCQVNGPSSKHTHAGRSIILVCLCVLLGKKGAMLARLHSADLGLAEAAYLKGEARLHEKDLAYRRAKNLLDNKAISQAEFYRREAE